MNKVQLVGLDGSVRNLDPTETVDIDVSVSNWTSKNKEGDYLYIDVGGNLVMKLIGDTTFHTFVVPNTYECRMAVKEISSTSTCSGIKSLH